jgi:hypothetical protein
VPIRLVSWLVVLTFLGAAIYFGLSDSWAAAVLFFLLFCGVELVVLVLVPLLRRDRDC